MQIFGKFSATTLQIARRLSCNYNARRYTSLVQTHKTSHKELLQQHELGHQKHPQQQHQLFQCQAGLGDLARQQYINDITRKEYHVINYTNNEMPLVITNLAPALNVVEPIKIMFIPATNVKDSLGALLQMQIQVQTKTQTQPKDKNSNSKDAATSNVLENNSLKKSANSSSKVSKFVIMNLIKGYENIHNRNNDYCMNQLPKPFGLGKLNGNPIVLHYSTNRDVIKSNLIISKFYSTNAKEKSERPSSRHVVCVAENGKGCVSPGNAQYPPFEPITNENVQQQATSMSAEKSSSNVANVNDEDLSHKLAQKGGKKCDPNHNYSSYENMFQENTLLKCDAYTKALQEAIKLKEVLEKEQKSHAPKVEEKLDVEKELNAVIASCGEASNAKKCPTLTPNSSTNANTESPKEQEDVCRTIRETRCTQQINEGNTSNQINKPEKKATTHPSNQGTMMCRSAIPQCKLFSRIPLRSAIQFKSRGMHAAKRGGKKDPCKDDPCKEEVEDCPDRCDDVFYRIRHNEDVIEQRKKKRKLVGCPPNKEKAKTTGVCAHVIPKKIKRDNNGDSNKKKYHTLSPVHQVLEFKPKSEIITQKEYHNFSVPMEKTHFKISLKPHPVFQPRTDSDLLGEAMRLSRQFTKTSYVLKDKGKGKGKGKGSPCKSKEKSKGQKKKTKASNPCEKPQKEYAAKCNEDPCNAETKEAGAEKKKEAGAEKKKEGDAGKKKPEDAKKKSDMCKKQTEEKKKEVSCKKKAEEKKKGDTKKVDAKKKDDAKKKIDPCKKDDAKKKEDSSGKKDDAKKKEDPSKKKDDAKKIKDPCAKKGDSGKKKDDAKKKKDPCAKKDDAKKKEDPCKKKDDAKKKKDSSGKKDDAKKKEDPCKKKDDSKKKEDSSGKKGEDPCKKKGDAKKKEDSSGKKGEDPCKKKDDAKKKEGSSGKKGEDPCKKKGDSKKKEDDSKKKCGVAKKETKPNCKKYSTLATSVFPSTPLQAFRRTFYTSNVKKHYCISNIPFKRNIYNTKFPNCTANFMKCNNMQKAVVDTINPVKPLKDARSISTYKINKNFIASNSGLCRYYSSKKGGSDSKGGKKKSENCPPKSVLSRARKADPNARPRDRLTTGCFTEKGSSICGESSGGLCPDPKKTACKEYVRKNRKIKTNKNKGNTTENKKFNLLKSYAQSIIKLKSLPPPTPLISPLIQAAISTSTSSSTYITQRYFTYSTQYNYRTVIPQNKCEICPEEEHSTTTTTTTTAATGTPTKITTACNQTIKQENKQRNLIRNEQINEQNEIIQICRACKIDKVYADIPNFSDYDVLIRMSHVAISGSDIHVYEHGSTNSSGITLGHDATGIIEKAGKCIYGLRRGDRVVVESGLSCGICEFCKRGAYNMCMNLLFNGFLMKYQVHPADLCHKLPDNLDIEEATLTHTLAQGCQAIFKAHITPTTNVLIMGSSPIALASAVCARAIGAKQVVLACTMHAALESIHNDFNFDYVHYDSCYQFGEILEAIFSAFNDWPDVVINCSINERTMNLAVMSLRPCGICILAECESEGASFNALDVLMKNIRLLPSFRSTNMFPTALHLMHTGRAAMSRMIASKFAWSDIDDAFQSAQCESNTGYKKVIIQCMEEHFHNYKAVRS